MGYGVRGTGYGNWLHLLPVVAVCLMLAACGFSPIYGNHDSKPLVHSSLNNVAIANIPDRQGQKLRNHLIDRMYASGRPAQPEAVLSVVLSSTLADLGIQKDATTTRSQLNMWASYSLRTQDGKELLKGKAHSVVGYSKLSAQYGTLAAEENAIDRALNEVGEQIVNRLSLYYAENDQPR